MALFGVDAIDGKFEQRCNTITPPPVYTRLVTVWYFLFTNVICSVVRSVVNAVYDVLSYAHPFMTAAHSGMKFSTPGYDNDLHTTNVAAQNGGGWWYIKTCNNNNNNNYYYYYYCYYYYYYHHHHHQHYHYN